MRKNTTALRQQLRNLRRNISASDRQQAALNVAKRLENTPFFINSPKIAAYWAFDGELNPKYLLEHARAMSKQVYLPVLAENRRLQFAAYQPDKPLRLNRYRIPEPDIPPAEHVLPSQLDLILTPIVAFDAAGTRLGMGGGFYDRSFAFLRDSSYRGKHPYLVGLGYELQRITKLKRQPWDVPLDAVVTEKALHLFCQRLITRP